MQYYTIIATAFFLFAWSRAVLRFKDKKISISELSFWTALWWGLAAVVVHPQIIAAVSGVLGIQRPIDVFVYGSIILLFYLVFKVYVKIDQTERDISKLVRTQAVNNPKRK